MIKFKVKSLKSKISLVSALSLLFFAGGCSSLVNYPKRFLGLSTVELERQRAEAISMVFSLDYPVCYAKTQDILKEIGAYIYAKDNKKRMIAIYLSSEDTTPVGLFFKEIAVGKTEIEVSSPSIYGKEIIAKRVFTMLEGLPDPMKKIEKGNEQNK
ncbi:MAG: hypothetical protein KJ926_06810 [Candidatus Omnitrophica bacterium]|nr:hypothetical protein [Candidatus Omnitrophota bacterium]